MQNKLNPLIDVFLCYQSDHDRILHLHFVSQLLTHWGRVMHICVGNLTIIGSDNGCHLDDTKPLSEPMLEYC